jgi:hypothetical protein
MVLTILVAELTFCTNTQLQVNLNAVLVMTDRSWF